MMAKSVRVGDLTFDNVSYDATGDVLYLHAGEPEPAADSQETPEGHVLRYDRQGRVIGLTLVNARWLLERDGAISITIPQPVLRVDSQDLAEALGLAS